METGQQHNEPEHDAPDRRAPVAANDENNVSEHAQSSADHPEQEAPAPAAPSGETGPGNIDAIPDLKRSGNTDDGVDQVTESSMESFPASDPPAWQ